MNLFQDHTILSIVILIFKNRNAANTSWFTLHVSAYPLSELQQFASFYFDLMIFGFDVVVELTQVTSGLVQFCLQTANLQTQILDSRRWL